MSAPPILLASASPRRRDILAGLGLAFEVVRPEVDELSEGPPERVVVQNAELKARAGFRSAGPPPGTLVIGCDTDVALDGRVLGKASDEAEARALLAALSGRAHTVHSGLAVGRAEAAGLDLQTAHATTEVTFADLDEPTLTLYLRSGEWRGRAGAYAIQGLGSILIERIEGDFSNVVGLPLPALRELAPELFSQP